MWWKLKSRGKIFQLLKSQKLHFDPPLEKINFLCIWNQLTCFWSNYHKSSQRRIFLFPFNFVSISKNIPSSICFNTTVSKLHSMLFICAVMFHAKKLHNKSGKKLNWIASNKISSAKLFVLLCSFPGFHINISRNLLIRQKYIEKNLCNRKLFLLMESFMKHFFILLVHILNTS